MALELVRFVQFFEQLTVQPRRVIHKDGGTELLRALTGLKRMVSSLVTQAYIRQSLMDLLSEPIKLSLKTHALASLRPDFLTNTRVMHSVMLSIVAKVFKSMRLSSSHTTFYLVKIRDSHTN